MGTPTLYTHHEWLQMRKERQKHAHMGASQIASAIGLNEHEPPYVLFQKMTGRLPADSESIAMRVGKHDEPLVAKLYSEATSIPLHTPGEYAVYQHPDIDWLFATPDYERYQIDPEPVECKRGDSMQARHWKDGRCPVKYNVQNIVQQRCMGARRGAVVGLIGYRLFTVECEASDASWNWAIDKLDKFRWHVLRDIPPKVDGSQATADALRILHPEDNGEAVELPEEIEQIVIDLQTVKRDIKALEATKRLYENEIRATLGDATYGMMDGQKIVSLKTQTRRAHEVAESTFRTLRLLGANTND